nr:hypothetical protein [uncultured Schaedlerella sp.]
MNIRTPYKVKCSECGAENQLNMELECVSSYERKKGLDLEYISTFEGACPKCGGDLAVQVRVWEYPEGFVESYTVIMEGAVKIEEPDFINEL